MSHVEQDSYANNADCQLFCDGIITATPNAAVLGILVYLNKSWKTTRYAFFARPFPFSFVDFAFSWSMKSLIMSCKASFLLVTSNTSSVVMVERPACREKLSRSIVTFSIWCHTISVNAPMNWFVALELSRTASSSTIFPMENQRAALSRSWSSSSIGGILEEILGCRRW